MLLPIALNLQNKRCLVVGGGPVAARKVASLLECGGDVHLVAPLLCSELEALRGALKYFERRFEFGDCDGCALVFACTDDALVNAQVAEAARGWGAWCNRADNSQDSDFHGAATIRRGEICLGISTGGGSPALARHLKARVEDAIGDEYGALLELMSVRRVALDARVPDQKQRARLWRLILQSAVLQHLKAGRREDAETLMDSILNGA